MSEHVNTEPGSRKFVSGGEQIIRDRFPPRAQAN
jgi:hypothetical protein